MSTCEIRAKIPGVFYRKPAPDQPNYKNPGDPVVEGDVLGLIEVMKSFQEVTCEATGTLGEFQVEDAEAIMAGQVLVVVEG
ncbi:biotin-dependent enzyme [Breoghania corrubedonensis]|uniref:Biotin carboxyl carrier protein of acetyl-CoA carboxylase n=1 Tax=Breoghania corrubedonensis TaxID=665038 RepID=A0A2T5VGI2_9HYPH|nr:acetyl-CoA carboxylase [Breoghania corrubedonensis]PTW62867.1 biotin-dependent enzyme [Breoghania corrubedonensis]